jgi:hypothetical protein
VVEHLVRTPKSRRRWTSIDDVGHRGTSNLTVADVLEGLFGADRWTIRARSEIRDTTRAPTT